MISSTSEVHPGSDGMYVQDTIAVSGMSCSHGDSGGIGYIRINGTTSILAGTVRGFSVAQDVCFVKAWRIATEENRTLRKPGSFREH